MLQSEIKNREMTCQVILLFYNFWSQYPIERSQTSNLDSQPMRRYSLLVTGMYHTNIVGFTNFHMTSLMWLRMHDCTSQNVRHILDNIKLNAWRTTCEFNIHKFVGTFIVYPIFYEF